MVKNYCRQGMKTMIECFARDLEQLYADSLDERADLTDDEREDLEIHLDYAINSLENAFNVLCRRL